MACPDLLPLPLLDEITALNNVSNISTPDRSDCNRLADWLRADCPLINDDLLESYLRSQVSLSPRLSAPARLNALSALNYARLNYRLTFQSHLPMATGTAVGSSSIAGRRKRTGFWTKQADTGQTRSLWASWPAAPAGRARARRQRLEMYAEELVAIADHAARGTSHPEAINRRACH
jgi:hypothetical protein